MELSLYTLKDSGQILSPALLYYKDLIVNNTLAAIATAGGAARLWPHVKSHKMRAMVDLQLTHGITRFKCATLSEAEMVAATGASHVLLAYPLVGPNIPLFVALTLRYPKVQFYALGDDLACLSALGAEAERKGILLSYFVDVNLGMHRTGVLCPSLFEFVQNSISLPGLQFAGLHCYDGHVHTSDPTDRTTLVRGFMAEVHQVITALLAAGTPVPMVIAGGSPSFPCHAGSPTYYLSPGTVFLWDNGYQEAYPDLPFVPAATIFTRVISHPAQGLFTLDLGCKGIASDPPGQRGRVVGLHNATPLFQSEEHWTFQMHPGQEDQRPAIGTAFYVIPTHICPTTALYKEALVVEKGQITTRWPVDCRR